MGSQANSGSVPDHSSLVIAVMVPKLILYTTIFPIPIPEECSPKGRLFLNI